MAVNRSEKTELLEKLNELRKKQTLFQQEISELEHEIAQLKVEEQRPHTLPEDQPHRVEKSTIHSHDIGSAPVQRHKHFVQKKPKKRIDLWKKSGIGSEIEQFIGTNLINKIGMIVVIIGVGIGAKYAIDNDLISPGMRIVLGYLVGVILGIFAFRLKKSYYNFSAVLASGAMAIFYFITYAAYTYYELYPYPLAFILMVLFTISTVTLALYYNRQIIAHFGLAGAYIVPFLLYAPDSSAPVLFTYMLIINCGILFLSTKKRWKAINYIAFVATWIIFISWFASNEYNNQLAISLIFASLFFAIFYLVFLSYKLILKEKKQIDDIIFLLMNASIFFIIGLVTLSKDGKIDDYAGLFSFICALIHGFSAVLFYRTEKSDKVLFYWITGIVIALFSMAIGFQFEPYTKTILWSFEAAFLFWLGRNKKIQLFDYISAVLVGITFLSLTVNWSSIYYHFYSDSINEVFTPVLNLTFLTSLVVIGSFTFIFYTSRKLVPDNEQIKGWLVLFNILFGFLLLLTIFFTFYNQIALYWNNIQVYTSYEISSDGTWIKAFNELNNDVTLFKTIWMINFTMVFLSVLSFSNFKWINNKLLNAFTFVLSALFVLTFLTSGLIALGELRDSYLRTDLPDNYTVSNYHLMIRYVAYLFFAFLFYSIYRFTMPQLNNKSLDKIFEVVLSASLITVCSSELINWLSLSGSNYAFKYGLSILWGVLSFALIVYGIWKKKKHLRITAIILFGGTILKLFFYDLTNLETVPKTIVFISIGALLLIVSFMYNKYKKLIFGND